MPRRLDTNTIGLPGLEEFGSVEKQIKSINGRTVSEEYGGANFGVYKGYLEDRGNGIDFPNPDDEKPLIIVPATMAGPAIINVDRPQLRDYQERAVKALLWAISRRNPTGANAAACIMATGTGKTTVGVNLALSLLDMSKKVLVVCNQEELINQWIDAFARYGIVALREQAEYKAIDNLGLVNSVVVIASQQTLRGYRLQSWGQDFFDLVIHDECDLSLCPTWKDIIAFMAGARHIGLTATPDRLDGTNISELFPVIPRDAQYGVTQAVREGWLVRPVEKLARHPDIDLSQLRITQKDFNIKDLDQIVSERVGSLAEASMEFFEDRPTIAFTPTVFSALALAEAYRQLGLISVSVSAETDERADVFDAFRRGEIDVLVNCAIVNRGVDLPIAENVVLARPTESRALFAQMCGRVMRPYYDEDSGYLKETCRIINFAWKFQKARHRLAHPTDLWDTRDKDEKVMEKARALYDQERTEKPDAELRVDEIIIKAEEEMKKELQVRLEVKAKGIKATATSLDPLLFEILEVPQRPSTNWMNTKAPSEEQLKYLQESFKVETNKIEGLTMQGAARMIDELKERRSVGKATWPQVKLLLRCKVPLEEAPQFSFDEAKAYLDANLPQQSWYGRTSKRGKNRG